METLLATTEPGREESKESIFAISATLGLSSFGEIPFAKLLAGDSIPFASIDANVALLPTGAELPGRHPFEVKSVPTQHEPWPEPSKRLAPEFVRDDNNFRPVRASTR